MEFLGSLIEYYCRRSVDMNAKYLIPERLASERLTSGRLALERLVS
jgi:hypothetical protein